MANGGGNKSGDYVVLRADRRRHLRSQLLVLKLKAMDERGTFFGYAKTISRGGMFVSTVNPRKVGEEFEIRFMLPGSREDATCRVKVAWRRDYDPKSMAQEPGMGLRFIDLSDDKKAKIEEWIKKNDG